MLGVWYNWMYKRSLTKPILKMIGTYEITMNDYVINECLSDEARKYQDAILMEQALNYIKHAQRFGAKLVPVAKHKERERNTKIFFELRFKNNIQRSEFEKFIAKQPKKAIPK